MIHTETRMLRYQFSPEEHAANCDEMARLLGARDEMELSHKQIKTSLKEELEALETNLSKLGRFVRDKCDHRKTECRWTMDSPEPGRKSLIRLDSFDVVDTARMEQHELQGELKFAGDGKRVDMSPGDPKCTYCDAGIPKAEFDNALHVNGEPCVLAPNPEVAADQPAEAAPAEEAPVPANYQPTTEEPNEHGVYFCDPTFRVEHKSGKFGASIEALMIGDVEWISCSHLSGPVNGQGGPLSRSGPYFPTLDAAVAYEAWKNEKAARGFINQSKGAAAKGWLEIANWLHEQWAGRYEACGFVSADNLADALEEHGVDTWNAEEVA